MAEFGVVSMQFVSDIKGMELLLSLALTAMDKKIRHRSANQQIVRANLTIEKLDEQRTNNIWKIRNMMPS